MAAAAFQAASLLVMEISALQQHDPFPWSSAEPPRKAAAAMIGCPTSQSPKTDKRRTLGCNLSPACGILELYAPKVPDRRRRYHRTCGHWNVRLPGCSRLLETVCQRYEQTHRSTRVAARSAPVARNGTSRRLAWP